MSPMTAAAILKDPANPRSFRLFLLAARPSKCGTYHASCVSRAMRHGLRVPGGGGVTVLRLAGYGCTRRPLQRTKNINYTTQAMPSVSARAVSPK